MINVFVGCAPNGEDIESQAVLEYTLRKHCTEDVQITWMKLSRDSTSPFYSDGNRGWQTQRWSTPFSGFRWLVPELCGFTGRVVYLDSDMIVMADLAELVAQPLIDDHIILAKGGQDAWRFCVSVWDCAGAEAHMLPGRDLMRNPDSHQAMTAKFRNGKLVQRFAGNWNCIDGENYTDLSDPAVKIVHYSAEDTQPHLRYALPRLARTGKRHWFGGRPRQHWRRDIVRLFDVMLVEAETAGYAPSNYLPTEDFGTIRLKSHVGYAGNRWSKRSTHGNP